MVARVGFEPATL